MRKTGKAVVANSCLKRNAQPPGWKPPARLGSLASIDLFTQLRGATRLYPIIGDPVRYTESPVRLTRTLGDRGHAGVCIPGMAAGDPLPVDAALLTSSMFVGDVIAGHDVTPFIRAAQATGCKTADGGHMVEAVQDLMADFMLGGWPTAYGRASRPG